VSRADQQLIAALEARNLDISPYQVERWRRTGLIPPNIRRSLGRGRGTTSELAPDAVACAATVAAAGDPKPTSIFWNCAATLAGRYPDMQEIASRPLRSCLVSLVEESDLVDIDEDRAYEEAAYASSPLFSSFSPERQHPLLQDVANVVDHKRRVHEHYLAASYLGVDVVGRRLLRQSVLELGFANDSEADLLIEFLERSFTPADERIGLLDGVDLAHQAYLLYAAALVVEWIQSDDWWRPLELPPSGAQIERLEALGLGFLKRLREPPYQLILALMTFLITEEEFQASLIQALGEEWSKETRSRIHKANFSVQVAPISATRLAEVERWRRQVLERRYPGISFPALVQPPTRAG
jgi:hypothetical protein